MSLHWIKPNNQPVNRITTINGTVYYTTVDGIYSYDGTKFRAISGGSYRGIVADEKNNRLLAISTGRKFQIFLFDINSRVGQVVVGNRRKENKDEENNGLYFGDHKLDNASCIDIDEKGNFYVTSDNNVIKLDTFNNELKYILEKKDSDTYISDDDDIRLSQPTSLTIYQGSIYIVDFGGCILRKVNYLGNISTIHMAYYDIRGKKINIMSDLIHCVRVDHDHNLLLGVGNTLVRLHLRTWNARVIREFIDQVSDIAIDKDGYIYIALNNYIRQISYICKYERPWMTVRYIWLGHMKEQDSPLNSLPRDIIKEICSYIVWEYMPSYH